MCLQRPDPEIPRERRMGVTIPPFVFPNYEKAQEHLEFRETLERACDALRAEEESAEEVRA